MKTCGKQLTLVSLVSHAHFSMSSGTRELDSSLTKMSGGELNKALGLWAKR